MKATRVRGLLLITLLLTATLVSLFNSKSASADQITVRSLTLLASTDGKTGGSTPSGTAAYVSGSNPNHRFTFTIPTTGNVGSVKFEYCTAAVQVACVAPTGMSASGVTFGGESGVTGFSIHGASTTANSVVITRTAVSVTGGTAATITLNNIQNPSTVGTFFVRISTYVAIDATGSAVDTGSVAASTANAIPLQGFMPESLIFCTGTTVNADCSTVTTGTINFTTLFSPSATSYATSQMAASTNAGGGYNITVNGNTLRSGTTNNIPAIASMKAPSTNTSEFGMNLMQNSGVASSANIAAASNGTSLTGQPLAGYSTTGQYKFTSGDSVANSASGGSPAPTNGQVYTVTYMVDVSGIQPAGTYTTTLTYICTATF